MRFQKAIFAGIVISCAAGLTRGASGAVTVLTGTGSGGSDIEDNFVGTAFITGTGDSTFSSFSLPSDYTAGPPYGPSQPELEFEAMNTDGKVGATLYTISGASNWSYNGGILTFTPPSIFDFAANTGYWAVFSDSGSSTGGDFWGTAQSTSYTAQLGFSIPPSNSVFVSTEDNAIAGPGGAYYNRAQYPLLYTLSVNPSSVPEPSTLSVLGFVGFAGILKRRKHRIVFA